MAQTMNFSNATDSTVGSVVNAAPTSWMLPSTSLTAPRDFSFSA